MLWIDQWAQNILNGRIFEPVEEYEGKCIAAIHRLDDDDDKLVIAPEEKIYTKQQIEALVEFQERFFEHEIIE